MSDYLDDLKEMEAEEKGMPVDKRAFPRPVTRPEPRDPLRDYRDRRLTGEVGSYEPDFV